MDLAHLVLAHTDPEHIARLARKLSDYSDVYIHIDSRIDLTPFVAAVASLDRVRLITTRFPSEWGGWNAVEATVALMREALAEKCYDRLSFLQGLDYPLKGTQDITNYFCTHRNIEFIRACNISKSSDPYFYDKCRYVWFPNNRDRVINLFSRTVSKIMRGADLKTRSGVIVDNNEKFDVFWGCAQWALTGHCAQYILEFYDSHPTFNRWFYYAFPADELYIHTIVFNSPYASQTTHGGPEPEAKPLERWRNLHYFESATNESGTVFGEHDYDRLRVRPELYVRKVTTEASSKLLDRLDADTKVTLTLPPNEVGTHTPGRHMQCPAENTTSMAVDFSAARTKVAPYITYEVVDVRGVTTRVHAAAVTHGGQEPRVSRSPLCGVTKALRVTRRRRGEDLNTVTCCRCRRRLQKAGVL